MGVQEEKPTEDQVREKTIPVFTVLKNGAIFKNIFIVNSRDLSSPERNGNTVGDDEDEVEEILVVGRHPDCDIVLTHPSISRFHLEIRSVPSHQKLFVTDLSSVHGTWVTDQKVEPDACVEVKEGDIIRIGGSTRIYRLHWIPLSRAYDIDTPFVSQLDAYTAMEQEEEDKMLEAEYLEVAHQNTALGGDGDLHMDVTSEGTGSSVLSEDDDTYITKREISLQLASPSVFQASTKWDLDVVEVVVEKPSSSCSPSKQPSGAYAEGLGCSELETAAQADECDVRGEGGLHLDVMSERMESSVSNEDEDPYLAGKEILSPPLPTDSIEPEPLQLRGVQASLELAIDNLEANAENPSSGCSPSKGQTDDCFEDSGSSSAFNLAAEVKILSFGREVKGYSGFVPELVMEVSAETKVEIRSHKDNGETEVSMQVVAASPSFLSQAEPTLETFTEETRGLVGSELQSEMAIEIESESLQQKSKGETKVGSRQANAVSDCFVTGYELYPRINAKGTQSLCSSWQPLPESEVEAPSAIWSEVTPAKDQNQKPGTTRETEKLFDEGSSSCLSEDLKQSGTQSLLLTPNRKPTTELSIGFGRSEESYSHSEIKVEENTDKESPILSNLASETFEEMPSDSQTPQTRAVRDDVLSEMDSSRSSSRRLSTCNIWSRRGKNASVLQLRTNKSEGKLKKIENQPKAQLHIKQALGDKSVSLTVHHGGEKLEPEIFTPDKENLTPSSHMLKRLQDIGDIKDSKSSSKLSGKSSSSKILSSIADFTSGAFKEPEIFTPDKENLTPNSLMLKRLREFSEIKETKAPSSKATRKPFFDIHVEENVMEEHKPNQHSMSSKSKVKPMEPKKKTERAPFQPLLEESSSQSQSYTNASFTTSARNNISRSIRSSSILSDTKSKMKWTIVLDTSSLLDKESRKPLNLLQGLKGTHLVVPRTVLRELNETKHSRSILYRRRRREIASSALDWIEECKVNTKWWIQFQSPLEETKATAPTPPVTPQSNGSSSFPFSFQWNYNAPEIDSPTSEDQVLECALLYRNRNIDEKLVLISNDVTLKIKAMAEGVICETAQEFYESLVNPLSERFMWRESSARGRTWSHVDDVMLSQRYENETCLSLRKKSTYNGGRREIGAAAKGLKLILLHNSHYGHIQ